MITSAASFNALDDTTRGSTTNAFGRLSTLLPRCFLFTFSSDDFGASLSRRFGFGCHGSANTNVCAVRKARESIEHLPLQLHRQSDVFPRREMSGSGGDGHTRTSNLHFDSFDSNSPAFGALVQCRLAMRSAPSSAYALFHSSFSPASSEQWTLGRRESPAVISCRD